MKGQRHPSPIRGAFQLLWDLNVKAVPSAMVWAISFWFVIESHSLVTRSAAVLLASLAAMFSSALIINESGTSTSVSWKNAMKDRFSWKIVAACGLLLDLSLENLAIADSRSYLAKLLFLSIFLSSLILWLYAVLIIVPLRTQGQGKEVPLDTVARSLNFIRLRKRDAVVSISVVFFAWPIFFVYVFLGLTFAQCVIVSSYGDLVDASVDSTKMRVQIA